MSVLGVQVVPVDPKCPEALVAGFIGVVLTTAGVKWHLAITPTITCLINNECVIRLFVSTAQLSKLK